jgi:hypothetical protein
MNNVSNTGQTIETAFSDGRSIICPGDDIAKKPASKAE